MRLHYFFFAHGKFWSERDNEEDVSMFDFVGGVQQNRMARCVGELVAMLLDPKGMGREHLKLLNLRLGEEPRDWPIRVLRALQVVLVLGISVLWRKLVYYFQAYPWALAPASDITRSDAERQTVLKEFFRASWCCLDPGLGRQLRKAFPSTIEQYWDTPLASFLTTLFSRLVMTSTQVELQFSKHSILTDTRSKRLGLGGLAAKTMNQCFKAWVHRWRDSVLSDQVPANTSRSRPAWTKTQNEGARK